MKIKQLSLWAGAALLGLSSVTAQGANIGLADYGFNIDGTTTYLSDPAEVDLGPTFTTTGLGTITASITGQGIHYFGAFFDHEILETGNTFFNELGAISGTPAAGQSWEIDDPALGFIYGDLEANDLQDTDYLDFYGAYPNDVSMAMAWDFSLAIDEVATIEFLLSEIMPSSGFYLVQSDNDSSEKIYLSSSLVKSTIPEPSILFLFGAGLAGFGLVAVRRRRLSVA